MVLSVRCRRTTFVSRAQGSRSPDRRLAPSAARGIKCDEQGLVWIDGVGGDLRFVRRPDRLATGTFGSRKPNPSASIEVEDEEAPAFNVGRRDQPVSIASECTARDA